MALLEERAIYKGAYCTPSCVYVSSRRSRRRQWRTSPHVEQPNRQIKKSRSEGVHRTERNFMNCPHRYTQSNKQFAFHIAAFYSGFSKSPQLYVDNRAKDGPKTCSHVFQSFDC